VQENEGGLGEGEVVSIMLMNEIVGKHELGTKGCCMG